MKRITFTSLLLLMMAATLLAIETTDTENQNFTLSVAGQNTNSVTAVTAVQPLRSIDGHMALSAGRQTADGTVTSENIDAEVVGQWKFIEGFIEGRRDLHRGITWESSIGYFLTPPPVKVGPATLRAGAGNSTANTQVKETLDIESDGNVSFNWIGFVQVDWWKTETTLIAEPSIDMKEVEMELDSSITHDLDENIAIGATWKTHFASHPITDDKTHSQYFLFVRLTR